MNNNIEVEKITKILEKAQQDLEILFLYVNVSSIEDFYKNKEEIIKKSYNTYNDVIKQINYIDNLEKTIVKMKNQENISNHKWIQEMFEVAKEINDVKTLLPYYEYINTILVNKDFELSKFSVKPPLLRGGYKRSFF